MPKTYRLIPNRIAQSWGSGMQNHRYTVGSIDDDLAAVTAELHARIDASSATSDVVNAFIVWRESTGTLLFNHVQRWSGVARNFVSECGAVFEHMYAAAVDDMTTTHLGAGWHATRPGIPYWVTVLPPGSVLSNEDADRVDSLVAGIPYQTITTALRVDARYPPIITGSEFELGPFVATVLRLIADDTPAIVSACLTPEDTTALYEVIYQRSGLRRHLEMSLRHGNWVVAPEFATYDSFLWPEYLTRTEEQVAAGAPRPTAAPPAAPAADYVDYHDADPAQRDRYNRADSAATAQLRTRIAQGYLELAAEQDNAHGVGNDGLPLDSDGDPTVRLYAHADAEATLRMDQRLAGVTDDDDVIARVVIASAERDAVLAPIHAAWLDPHVASDSTAFAAALLDLESVGHISAQVARSQWDHYTRWAPHADGDLDSGDLEPLAGADDTDDEDEFRPQDEPIRALTEAVRAGSATWDDIYYAWSHLRPDDISAFFLLGKQIAHQVNACPDTPATIPMLESAVDFAAEYLFRKMEDWFLYYFCTATAMLPATVALAGMPTAGKDFARKKVTSFIVLTTNGFRVNSRMGAVTYWLNGEGVKPADEPTPAVSVRMSFVDYAPDDPDAPDC